MPVASKVSNQHGFFPSEDVSGIILAGGKSTRYGKNKALVKIDGIPLIERVIQTIRPLFRDLILITNTPETYAHLELPMYADIIKGLGPISGIHTGLTVLSGDAGFFVACDMPRLNPELIAYMVLERGRFDVTVPRISGMMEALHAIYRKGCLPFVKRLIDERQYQAIRLFKQVSVRYIEEDEIRRFDPQLRSFLNINRPEELKSV